MKMESAPVLGDKPARRRIVRNNGRYALRGSFDHYEAECLIPKGRKHKGASALHPAIDRAWIKPSGPMVLRVLAPELVAEFAVADEDGFEAQSARGLGEQSRTFFGHEAPHE